MPEEATEGFRSWYCSCLRFATDATMRHMHPRCAQAPEVGSLGRVPQSTAPIPVTLVSNLQMTPHLIAHLDCFFPPRANHCQTLELCHRRLPYVEGLAQISAFPGCRHQWHELQSRQNTAVLLGRCCRCRQAFQGSGLNFGRVVIWMWACQPAAKTAIVQGKGMRV